MKRKPPWLIKKQRFQEMSETFSFLRKNKIATICEESRCPNQSECFSQKQASFLILGKICTRQCLFCNVEKKKPLLPDEKEPQKTAEAIRQLGLTHAVITSPTRDDLEDGGASVFAQTIKAVRLLNPKITIEVLIPDFQGKKESLSIVAEASPTIIGHNMETISRLYALRKGADYKRSLMVLEFLKKNYPSLYTKSAFLLGMGETQEEIIEALKDLKNVGCDFVAFGQYLPPSRKHYPVQEYIALEQFDFYKQVALDIGFLSVESSPFTRSSYHASEFLKKMYQK